MGFMVIRSLHSRLLHFDTLLVYGSSLRFLSLFFLKHFFEITDITLCTGVSRIVFLDAVENIGPRSSLSIARRNSEVPGDATDVWKWGHCAVAIVRDLELDTFWLRGGRGFVVVG